MKGLDSRLGRALPLILLILCGSACGIPGTKVKAQQDKLVAFDRPVALAAARKSSVPPPLMIMLESDPWNMVIGSDSPSFALYADGTVIHRSDGRYKSVRLSAIEQQELLRSLGFEDLSRLEGYYHASDWTDQTNTLILAYAGEKPFYISIYGPLGSPDTRSKLPGEIVSAYDRLQSFTHARATDWLPSTIEVMIWPYDYAPDPSIVWPRDWPGLDSPTTKRRGEQNFSLYLPSVEAGRLRSFLATRPPKGAVEIGGKKWAASTRYPFPHENLWMGSKTP